MDMREQGKERKKEGRRKKGKGGREWQGKKWKKASRMLTKIKTTQWLPKAS
jgi:hypothetical protein